MGQKKQNSANNGTARSALLASIEKGTKLKPTKNIKDSSAPVIGNSSGSSGPLSSGGNISHEQNAKGFNAIDENSDFDSQIKHAVNQRLRKMSTDPVNSIKGSKIKEDVKSTRKESIIPEQVIKQEKFKCKELSSIPSQISMQNATDNVTSSNQQLRNKPLKLIESNVINTNVEKKEDSLRKGSSQDKACTSADNTSIHTNKLTADNDSTTRKISVDILNSIKSGPNLQSKDSSNRNFGERMVALQKAGKLISREEKEKMDQSNKELKPVSTEKDSSPKMSWKSEYSVSNEASKTAGSMFGLNPSLRKTTINQHHGTDYSLAGGIRNPSNNEPHHSSSSHIRPSQPTPSIGIGRSTDHSKSSGAPVQAEPGNKSFIPSGTTSKTVRKFQDTPKSVNSIRNTQSPSNKKVSKDDVQICSCVESATIGGTNKCSHSGPNAIHLNMDKVMQFLAESEK